MKICVRKENERRKEQIMERANEMQIEFDARSCNEGFVRVSVALSARS